MIPSYGDEEGFKAEIVMKSFQELIRGYRYCQLQACFSSEGVDLAPRLRNRRVQKSSRRLWCTDLLVHCSSSYHEPA